MPSYIVLSRSILLSVLSSPLSLSSFLILVMSSQRSLRRKRAATSALDSPTPRSRGRPRNSSRNRSASAEDDAPVPVVQLPEPAPPQPIADTFTLPPGFVATIVSTATAEVTKQLAHNVPAPSVAPEVPGFQPSQSSLLTPCSVHKLGLVRSRLPR